MMRNMKKVSETERKNCGKLACGMEYYTFSYSMLVKAESTCRKTRRKEDYF
jgi:hypothetical protein